MKPQGHLQTPKMRPLAAHRSTTIACLDVGTSRVACLIARLRPTVPGETLRGRTHAIELLGFSEVQSRGMKAGTVVDLAECETVVRNAVTLAETMAKVRIERVLLAASGGRLHGEMIEASSDLGGRVINAGDVARVTSVGMHHAAAPGRTVVHAMPVGFALDGVKGIRDPDGMVASQFGIDMNVVTADAAIVRNLMLVVERCHLEVEAVAAGPYLAGLSVLTDDELDQGVALIELGAGTTTIATHANGQFTHLAGFAVGGQHITRDLARGLGATFEDAERIKTLHGSVLTGGTDARDTVAVPAADEEQDGPRRVTRAQIAGIVRPRAEEIFEMIRDRLATSPFAHETRGRVVLSGGGAQLNGIAELAGRILNRPVRVGRPLGFAKLPPRIKAPSFSVPTGLLIYPQFAHLEHVERKRALQDVPRSGYLGKVGQWLREGF